MEKNKRGDSLLSRMKRMNVGETLTVPVGDYAYNTVGRYVSDLSFFLERKYTYRLCRETRLYEVARLS